MTMFSDRLIACLLPVAAALGALGCSRPAAGEGGQAPTAADAVPPMRVGVTLGSPSYWSAEWPFADIVQSTAGLVFLSPAGAWEPLTTQVSRDAGGHPIDVPAGTRLIVILQQGSPRVPAGKYRCTISPGWSIRPFGDWKMDGGGTSFGMTIPQPVSKLGVALILTATKDRAALTTLGCRPPGEATETFNPAFLADNKPYSVLRFMDWMRTNNAPPREWAKRATPGSFSQAGPEGVALEHMVALANGQGADPWFSVQLDADPGYYRAFASYVRDHLSPERTVYVEVSNEVWNTGFTQGKEATARGQAKYPGVRPAEANDYYYADRVREVMAIWSEVFAKSPKRLVRVLSSQAVNPRRAENALSHDDTWRSVDALATAPYFGSSGNEIALTGRARVDEVFRRGPKIIDDTIRIAKAAKAIAASHGLRYITYEGGPGFMAYNAGAREDMLAVNRDPRMHDLYLAFLRRWQSDIGDLLMVFDSVSTPSVGGTFGHKEYTGQPLSEAPKARAIVDFQAELKR